MLPRRQRNRRDKGRVVQTPATRKSFGWRARSGSAGSLQELQTPAGLPPFRRGGEEAAFWVTECRGLLTQVTRHPGSVLTERRGHLSPPAPVPSGPSRGRGCSQPGSGAAPEKGAAGSCKRCWERRRNSPPEIQSHPGLASGTRRGCQGGGCHEEAAEEMQAPGELEQLQHSPGTGSRQDGQSEQERRGLEKIRRDEEGVGSEAGSEHVPEARTSSIQDHPLSRHGSSREATAGNWLRHLAALPGSLSSSLIWARLSLLSPPAAKTSTEFLN